MYDEGEGVTQDDKLAVQWYTKAAEQGDVNAHNNLAWVLATCPNDSLRNGQEAVTHARKACELTEWQDVDCVDTLAAAYAEAGRFEDAVKYQRKALEDADFLKSDGEEAAARLALYEAGKPYRSPVPAVSE